MLAGRMRMAAGAGGGGDAWYLAGGAPMPVAVYEAKGAASLAASYVNIVNPGTYDAAPGVAPTWDAVNGWKGNGSTTYLTTGLIPSGDWSLLVRFSGTGADNAYLLGQITSGKTFGAAALRSGASAYQLGNNQPGASSYASGVMAIGNSTKGYINGTVDTGILAGFSGAATNAITILCLNNNGTPALFTVGYIQAVAVYNNTLDDSIIAAVSAEMDAL